MTATVVTKSFSKYLSGGLSSEALITAAQSMEEIYYVKGEDIIVQDDIGDSFFVLEEGKVSITVSSPFIHAAAPWSCH